MKVKECPVILIMFLLGVVIASMACQAYEPPSQSKRPVREAPTITTYTQVEAPPTAVPQRRKPIARPTLTQSENRAGRPRPTTRPGNVSPAQIGGEIISISNPVFARGGSEELVVVTFKNTSNVATHYRIEGDDSGEAYRNGWRILNQGGIRCSSISKNKSKGGAGDCEQQNIYPGTEFEVHYMIRSPSSGTARITWILKAAHTCGTFGCRIQVVDKQSPQFSVSTR